MQWKRLSWLGFLSAALMTGVAFAGGPGDCEGKSGGKGCGTGYGWTLPDIPGLGGDCCLGEPWTLFGKHCSGIEAGGWVQLGYTTEGTNQGVIPAHTGGTGLFNNHPNTVDLQQAWAWIGKETDTTCQTWDWGFHMDYVYGTDGPDTQAFGGRLNDWDNSWNAGGFYGHAIPQLYAEVAYNDLTIKGGHFYTHHGYEVVQAPQNFFYSHAFTMVLAEPFTHSGVMTEYDWNDNITLYNGWSAGWDIGFSANNGSVYLGGVGLQLTEKSTLTYAMSYGDFGFGVGGSDDPGYSHSLVWDWKVNSRWNYVFQTDYIDNQAFVDGAVGAFGAIPRTNGHMSSLVNYLFYSINDCWALGGRFEYFNIGGNEITEFTMGANYRPCANVVFRPEFRIDSFEAGAAPLKDSSLFGMDMIMTF